MAPINFLSVYFAEMKAMLILFLLTSPANMVQMNTDFTDSLHEMPISDGHLRDQLVLNDLTGETMGYVVRAGQFLQFSQLNTLSS